MSGYTGNILLPFCKGGNFHSRQEVASLSKMGSTLKGKNLPPEGSKFFPLSIALSEKGGNYF